jgi:glutamine amidotransferase
MSRVGIINYGMGNLGSIQNALSRLKVESGLITNKEQFKDFDKLILPGVGNFKQGVENIKSLGLWVPLNEYVLERKTPILGICLGYQLFSESSQEGDVEGLKWVDAKTIRFSFEAQTQLRVPHVGWNTVEYQESNPMFSNIPSGSRFYFTHSYCVQSKAFSFFSARTEYGFQFTSAVVKENIFGVQFHPEKSHGYGLQLIENFVKI